MLIALFARNYLIFIRKKRMKGGKKPFMRFNFGRIKSWLSRALYRVQAMP